MIFNVQQFLDDFGIPNTNRGKHARAGWVQIKCPFCSGHPGWHGGFNIEKEYYNCWRCGWHSTIEVIMALLNCTFPEAKTYLKKYQNRPIDLSNIDENQRSRRPPYHSIPLPKSCYPLGDSHKKYLQSRNFDPDELTQEWNLYGTRHLGNYKFRIIAPIYFHNQFVSYQGRDITGKQSLPYMACKPENEIISHKHILYGIDKAQKKSVIIVEGITDVWRLGPGAVATFGLEFTSSQIRLLVDRFNSIFIFYDSEPQAQNQANKLCIILTRFKKKVENIQLTEGDPGDLPSKEARMLKMELLSN